MAFRTGASTLALLLGAGACIPWPSTDGTGGGAGSTSTLVGSCGDRARDGAESDVDCGGPCPACVNGKKCAGPVDCESGVCAAGTCAPCGTPDDCANGKGCVAGTCSGCANNAGCVLGQVCSAGSCGPCTQDAQCGTGLFCTAGTCSPCTSDAQCPTGLGCVQGQCGTCSISSQCGAGKVCNLGRCAAGFQMEFYQCPGMTDLGGGSWGFYGCQAQLTNTSSCLEIEYPTSQAFPCQYAGKLTIVTDQSAAPPDATYAEVFQCPGAMTSPMGAAWSFYGCQGQVSSTPTCNQIDFPASTNYDCAPIGRMTLTSTPPAPPPGGAIVPMYQCPGVTSLGGGDWGYYGCQNQIASTPTCLEIESPNQQTFACSPVGSIVVEP